MSSFSMGVQWSTGRDAMKRRRGVAADAPAADAPATEETTVAPTAAAPMVPTLPEPATGVASMRSAHVVAALDVLGVDTDPVASMGAVSSGVASLAAPAGGHETGSVDTGRHMRRNSRRARQRQQPRPRASLVSGAVFAGLPPDTADAGAGDAMDTMDSDTWATDTSRADAGRAPTSRRRRDTLERLMRSADAVGTIEQLRYLFPEMARRPTGDDTAAVAGASEDARAGTQPWMDPFFRDMVRRLPVVQFTNTFAPPTDVVRQLRARTYELPLMTASYEQMLLEEAGEYVDADGHTRVWPACWRGTGCVVHQLALHNAPAVLPALRQLVFPSELEGIWTSPVLRVERRMCLLCTRHATTQAILTQRQMHNVSAGPGTLLQIYRNPIDCEDGYSSAVCLSPSPMHWEGFMHSVVMVQTHLLCWDRRSTDRRWFIDQSQLLYRPPPLQPLCTEAGPMPDVAEPARDFLWRSKRWALDMYLFPETRAQRVAWMLGMPGDLLRYRTAPTSLLYTLPAPVDFYRWMRRLDAYRRALLLDAVLLGRGVALDLRRVQCEDTMPSCLLAVVSSAMWYMDDAPVRKNPLHAQWFRALVHLFSKCALRPCITRHSPKVFTAALRHPQIDELLRNWTLVCLLGNMRHVYDSSTDSSVWGTVPAAPPTSAATGTDAETTETILRTSGTLGWTPELVRLFPAGADMGAVPPSPRVRQWLYDGLLTDGERWTSFKERFSLLFLFVLREVALVETRRTSATAACMDHPFMSSAFASLVFGTMNRVRMVFYHALDQPVPQWPDPQALDQIFATGHSEILAVAMRANPPRAMDVLCGLMARGADGAPPASALSVPLLRTIVEWARAARDRTVVVHTDLLPWLPYFGAERDAVSDLSVVAKLYADHGCGVVELTTRCTRALATAPRLHALLSAWCATYTHTRRIITYPLPVDMMRAQTAAVRARHEHAHLPPDAPLPPVAVCVFVCQGCGEVYDAVATWSDADGRPVRNTMRGSRMDFVTGRKTCDHCTGDTGTGAGTVVTAALSLCQGSGATARASGVIAMVNVLGEVLVCRRGVLLLCPQPRCGALMQLTPRCRFTQHGPACSFCSVELDQTYPLRASMMRCDGWFLWQRQCALCQRRLPFNGEHGTDDGVAFPHYVAVCQRHVAEDCREQYARAAPSTRAEVVRFLVAMRRRIVDWARGAAEKRWRRASQRAKGLARAPARNRQG